MCLMDWDYGVMRAQSLIGRSKRTSRRFSLAGDKQMASVVNYKNKVTALFSMEGRIVSTSDVTVCVYSLGNIISIVGDMRAK